MPAFRGSDGAELHYDVAYSGTEGTEPLSVIALAGGAAKHPSYLGNLAGLDTRYRLVVPHLRGVGRSPMPDSPDAASFWRQAEDIEQLRLHLRLQQLHLLGHSAGTRLAVAYAAQFPDRVAALVLVTPPTHYLVDVPSDVEEVIKSRRGEPAFDAALADWEAGPAATDDGAFNAWWLRVAPMSYASWGPIEQAHASVGVGSFAANRAYFAVEPPADLVERLQTVQAPVLVVAGAEDCSLGVAPVLAVADVFRAGRAVLIDRAGHHPWVEQPAAFRTAVDTFLDSIPASGR